MQELPVTIDQGPGDTDSAKKYRRPAHEVTQQRLLWM